MPHSSNESEWLTRKKRINPKLKALGWEIVPFNEKADLSKYTRHAIVEYQTDNGPADYALVVKLFVLFQWLCPRRLRPGFSLKRFNRCSISG